MGIRHRHDRKELLQLLRPLYTRRGSKQDGDVIDTNYPVLQCPFVACVRNGRSRLHEQPCLGELANRVANAFLCHGDDIAVPPLESYHSLATRYGVANGERERLRVWHPGDPMGPHAVLQGIGDFRLRSNDAGWRRSRGGGYLRKTLGDPIGGVSAGGRNDHPLGQPSERRYDLVSYELVPLRPLRIAPTGDHRIHRGRGEPPFVDHARDSSSLVFRIQLHHRPTIGGDHLQRRRRSLKVAENDGRQLYGGGMRGSRRTVVARRTGDHSLGSEQLRSTEVELMEPVIMCPGGIEGLVLDQHRGAERGDRHERRWRAPEAYASGRGDRLPVEAQPP